MNREDSIVTQSDTYRAYAESSMVGVSPINLVTSLYEGAIDTLGLIRQCFVTNDIMGRSKAVTKVVNILTELLLSLDHEKGGEISANLKRLYSYMQCRVLEAHAKKNPSPLEEIERLLKDLLESWYAVAKQNTPEGALVVSASPARALVPEEEPAFRNSRVPLWRLLYRGKRERAWRSLLILTRCFGGYRTFNHFR